MLIYLVRSVAPREDYGKKRQCRRLFHFVLEEGPYGRLQEGTMYHWHL